MNLGDGSQQARFRCQEDSGLGFDRLIIRYRKNSTQEVLQDRGRPRTGWTRSVGVSAWTQLEREEQTLTCNHKATLRSRLFSGSRHLPLRFQL